VHENWARPSAIVSVGFGRPCQRPSDRVATMPRASARCRQTATHHRPTCATTLSRIWAQQENPIPIYLPPLRAPISGSAFLLPCSHSTLLLSTEHRPEEPGTIVFVHLRVVVDRCPRLHSSRRGSMSKVDHRVVAAVAASTSTLTTPSRPPSTS
jgi:hypothetical protein